VDAELVQLHPLCMGHRQHARGAAKHPAAGDDVEGLLGQPAPFDPRRGAVRRHHVGNAGPLEMIGGNRAGRVAAGVQVRHVEGGRVLPQKCLEADRQEQLPVIRETLAQIRKHAYLNALHNPFVYDDYRTIVENVSVQSPGSFRAIVLHDITRPIVNLSYAADRALWGAQPFGFHVTSVLLHMLNVVLLCQLAWRFADDLMPASDGGREAGSAKRAAARSAQSAMTARGPVVASTAAVLFAVHPMMTEAVGYISGRSEVLCATFFLLALMSGRRWLHGDGAIWAMLSIALWLVALAT